MDKIIVSFGTAEPVKFVEPLMDEEFEARLRGKAYVSEYDTSLYKYQPFVSVAENPLPLGDGMRLLEFIFQEVHIDN